MNKVLKLVGRIALLPLLAAVLLLATSPYLAAEYDADAVLPHVLTSTDYSLCVAAAALLAMALMAVLQRKDQSPVDVPLLALLTIPLGLVGGRLVFVLSRIGMYTGRGALNPLAFADGGYMLYGVVAGAVGAAAIYAWLEKQPMSHVLDAMAVPGLLMIALCRGAEFFTTEGRGEYMEQGFFPAAVYDASWEMWAPAVFLWEAVIALIIMAVVIRVCREGRGAFLMALVLYCCCQAVLESLREDNLPRFGFVQVSQVLSGVIVLGLTAWRAFREWPRGTAWLRTVICVLLIAAIGISEWALDKTNISNVVIYLAMCLFSAGMGFNCLWIGRHFTAPGIGKQA